MPLTAIPARRHPHQVLVALLLLVSGTGLLFGGPRPGSITATLPPPLLYVWAVTSVAGGALVVAAAVARSAETALYLELVADLPLALVCTTYAAAAFSATGWRAAVAPVAVVLATAGAFAIRAWQVWRTLTVLRATLGGGDA